MEQGLKERLIGAAVLVVLAVWLIPWLLDGPDELAEDGPVSLQLPVPPEQPVGQVRTETIDLRPPRENDSPVISADDSAVGRRADIRAVESSSPVSTPPSRDPTEPGEPSAAGSVDVEPPSVSQPTNDGAVAAGSSPGGVRGERTAAPPADDDEPAAPPATATDPQNAVESPPVQSTPSPSRPAVAAAPSPAQPAATGEWALQLGSFGDESNARRLADRVSSFGYTPQITNYRAGGRTMYRVRIGPHETRARAEAAASALSAHGFVAQVVTAD